MKKLLSLCLSAGFVAVAPAVAQVPGAPRPHSLSLTVEPLSTGGKSIIASGTRAQTSQTTGTGSSYRATKTETDSESESIQVTVHNFSTGPDTAQVEWYFVEAPAQANLRVPLADQLSIFDKGSKSVTIAPGGAQAFPVVSSTVSSKFKRSSKSKGSKAKKGGVQETGSVLGGWMVRVVADGKTLETKASKDQLDEIIKDNARLDALKGR